jgi:malate permease and related proteins
MLVVLGLQLRSSGERIAAADVTAVVFGRLLVAPVVGWVVATVVGLRGVERGTMVVLAAMPVAVVTTILAAEFRARVDFVARVVAVSTVVSIPTLTVLISLVR